MIKVSVIVPIYNVDKYLRNCLDSIILQTLQDIEIILINDASPDLSADIMEEYAAKDARISCIYLQENLMMGGARNKGIDKAKGEYLTFVDSDDYLELTMLEKLYHKAKATDSDMAYCTYHYVRENGELIKDVYLFPPEFEGELTQNKKRGIINKLAFPWGKLFRRSIWLQEKIYFPEGIIYEDGPTIPLSILYMKQCAFVEEALYYYVLHDESAMNKRNSQKHLDTMESAVIFLDRMKERGFYEQYKQETDFYVITRYYKNLVEICFKYFDKIPIDILKSTKQYIKDNYKQYRNNPYYLTLTGEERILLRMNDIHPMLAIWWNRNRVAIMKLLGKRREGLLYYKKYYKCRKYRLIEMLERHRQETTGIWGAGLKKTAMLQCIRNKETRYIDYDIINNQKDSISGNEILFDKIKDTLQVIYVVNPSTYINIKQLVEASECKIKLINLEDYLNGYIEYD
jgi:glycosyltransferase involved in cell wall biosynthesis